MGDCLGTAGVIGGAFFSLKFSSSMLCLHLAAVCPLSNISTGIEETAGPIKIKFGVVGRLFLNNIIFNCCNLFYLT